MSDPFEAVVGQDAAVAMLRAALLSPLPAYLLVGPSGSGLREAAASFAGGLLGAGSVDEDVERHRRLAVAEEHPDLVVVERDGAFISADQARDAVRAAFTSPIEGRTKVVLIVDVQLLRDAGPMLLKAIEEPPQSTVFVLLATEVPPELITIASRCVRVDFASLSAAAVRSELLVEGTEAARASFAADASGGSLDRARLLAADDEAAQRWSFWTDLPSRLDGSGNAAAGAAGEILESIEAAAGPLELRQARELAELEERAERFGERGLGRAGLLEGHKRELRRLRADELRMGFSALGRSLRDRIAGGELEAGPTVGALMAVGAAGEALSRNPNERLLLQRLFLQVSAN